MELKTTLKDYTAQEFQALVDKIRAVDLLKQDHDRLINHFDRISGHPQGADLLFYPDDRFDTNDPGLVVYHVRDWHHKRGVAAFKGEVFPVPARPMVSPSLVARNQADLQKIITDIAVSEQILDIAFSRFELAISHLRGQGETPSSIAELETNIRTLEHARDEAHSAVRTLERWKMRVEFAVSGTQRNLTHARSDQAQWHAQLQQISATHDRYMARLAINAQRSGTLRNEAEILLTRTQEQLIRARNLAGRGPAQAASAVTASLAFADKRPDILLGDGQTPLEVSQRRDLQKSIRSAVAEFTWQTTSQVPVKANQCAAVLHFGFHSRADTQVYGLSVPLADLVPVEGQDWQYLAQTRAQVAIPFRMSTAVVAAKPGVALLGIRDLKIMSQVYITAFQTRHSTPKVRVRPARHNQGENSFSFTTDDAAPITVCWSGTMHLDTGASGNGAQRRRLGFVQSPPVPILEPLIDEEDVRFDDYVVVFPVESGLDPLYVTFRSRREYPV